VVLAHLRRWWFLSSREGFEFLSPSCRACDAGFGAFWGSETPIFYCAGGGETEASLVCFSLKNSDRTLDQTRSRVDLRVRSAQVEDWGAARLGFVTGRWSGLTSAFGQFTWAQRKGAQPVCLVPHRTGASGRAPRGGERGEELIGNVARLVTCDRTRPVTVGALYTPTGRRVQRVRSNAGARPVTATTPSDTHCCCLSCSDRTRPVTLTGASGHLVFNCVVR
jgi:hypothetical protein